MKFIILISVIHFQFFLLVSAYFPGLGNMRKLYQIQGYLCTCMHTHTNTHPLPFSFSLTYTHTYKNFINLYKLCILLHFPHVIIIIISRLSMVYKVNILILDIFLMVFMSHVGQRNYLLNSVECSNVELQFITKITFSLNDLILYYNILYIYVRTI